MKYEVRSYHSKTIEAYLFHEKAGPYFREIGFKLVDDPSLSLSPYRQSRVTYRSSRGLFVAFWFEPADGQYAFVEIGRQWSIKDSGQFRLSNKYYRLARIYDIGFPKKYELTPGQETRITFNDMLQDIKSTLPVLSRCATLHDLLSIESQKFGALRWAKMLFGPNYQECIDISPFN